MSRWSDDLMTKWPDNMMTGSFADDWPYGIFCFHYIEIGSDSVWRLLIAFVDVIYQRYGIGRHDTGGEKDQKLHTDVDDDNVDFLAMWRSES